MWILPKNYPLSSHYVADMVASSEDLSLLDTIIASSLFVRLKPMSKSSLLRKWKRDKWFRHLCGQILKPSQHRSFETRLISYLQAIPANRLAKPVDVGGQMIHATCGPTSRNTSEQYDLFDVSSKTCKDTSRWDSPQLSQIWKNWVIEQRGEYSQRKKSAHLIREKECLSWPTPIASSGGAGNDQNNLRGVHQGNPLATAVTGFQPDQDKTSMNGKNQELSNWPTPTVNCVEGGEQSDRVERSASGGYVLRKKNKPNATYGAKLSDATLFEERQKQENWPTPTTQEIEHKNIVLTKTGRRLTKDGSNSHSLNLTDKVNQENWPTPAARDHKGTNSPEKTLARVDAGLRGNMGQLPNAVMVNEIKNWPTPTTAEANKIGNNANYGQRGLSNHPSIVGPVTREKSIKSGKEKKWATPASRDYKGSYSPEALVRKDGKSRMDGLPQQAQYDKTNISKTGKLNPDWCEQLMGLPVGWTKINDTDDRISRLMAIGNGVVPQTAALAWEILNAKLMTTKTED
jgi:hypothetical protein